MADIDTGHLFTFGGKKSQNQGQGQEQKQQGTGFFGKKALQQDNTAEFSSQVTSLTDRLKILEEHYNNLRRKTQLTDQTVLSNQKKAIAEIKNINIEVTEIRREVSDIKDKIKLIIKELQACTKNEDFEVLKKYIDMWEPVNFVTRNELQKILDEYGDK